MAGRGRRSQTDHRAAFRRIQRDGGYCKYHPLLEWSDADIEAYFENHRLPRHPLAAEGYVTVGDAHLSAPSMLDDTKSPATVRETRFGGRAQECGIHVVNDGEYPVIPIPGIHE